MYGMYVRTHMHIQLQSMQLLTVLKFKHNVAPIRLHVVVQTQGCTVYHMPCNITIFITLCMGVVL